MQKKYYDLHKINEKLVLVKQTYRFVKNTVH